MMHRIRLALQNGTFEKMGGEGETIEVDEIYIGGLARNMHADRRRKTIQGRTGGFGKQAVFGLLERRKGGKTKVRAQVIPANWSQEVRTIKALVRTGNGWSCSLGGLLALGKYPQQFFPALAVTLVAYPGSNVGEPGPASERFIDNFRVEGGNTRYVAPHLRIFETKHEAAINSARRIP